MSCGEPDGSSREGEGVNGRPFLPILPSALNISCSVFSSLHVLSVNVVVTVGNSRPSNSVKARGLKGLGTGIKET
jgi:hypothetical protein